MANIFAEIDGALLKAGSFLLALAKYAHRLFANEQQIAPEAAKAAVLLFEDVENFLSLAAPAVSGAGLNFPADSAAYAAFLKMVDDAKHFVSTAEQVLKAVKG